eukprot:TRINITY_DN7677_c0_g1_i1.p1 TRINITY_DN7677_c0_g1~~TRINITY_DN7677_c0_g1_i1.p1  ORF type:complete len:377 (-),score=59.44 TRINITY_DN7677_c0_g1_i1:155-1285(-)
MAGVIVVLILLITIIFTIVWVKSKRNKRERRLRLSRPHSKTGASVQHTEPITIDTEGTRLIYPDYIEPTPSSFSESFEEIVIDDLVIGARIGKGSFAEVFKAKWRGTEVAVKKLPAQMLGGEFFEDFENEAELMRQLRHPNVLQFLGACMISPDICIITEFMNRGSLYKILHTPGQVITWPVVKRFCLDAARGMSYLHGCSPPVFHRDLKSHNLLVDEHWKVKVCDFGLSRIVEESLTGTMTSCGTPCWTAPEILRNERYTEKADVYSYGIVLWEMSTREDPYKGMPPFQVVFAVGTQKIRPKLPLSAPSFLVKLITECWDEDAMARPSFEEVIEKLEKWKVDDGNVELPTSATSSRLNVGRMSSNVDSSLVQTLV